MTPEGRPASSTAPGTWSPWEAVRGLERRGFVLDGDGVVCVDLDHCVDGGVLAGWAREILDRCPSTYVEVSPSGTGLHIWGYADVSVGRMIRDHRAIEVYGRGRYIAVTGRRFGAAPARLADISTMVGEVSA